jgi:large repetitive protein
MARNLVWNRDQTITFGALTAKTMTDVSFTVSATASSGGAVVFTSLTPAVCTVAGNVVTLVGTGTGTIAANQPGQNTTNPAPQVTQNFTVT